MNCALKAIISLTLLLIGCTERQSSVTSGDNNPKDTSINLTFLEKGFQLWLKDTLPPLKIWQSEKEDFIEKKEVNVSDDSMRIIIKVFYNCNYNSKNNYPKEILNVLDLLREYEEFPNVNDSISCVYYTEFYPSEIEQMSHGTIFEVQDLIKKTRLKNEKFDYIRGRISNKDEYEKNGNLISSTDYLWEENKLKKVERKHN